MSTELTEIDTGVTLPESGIVDINYLKDMLSRVDLFSNALMAYGRGQVFMLARSNFSGPAYEQTVTELGYTVDTANSYIEYLEKKPVLEAIRKKYYVAVSLSASEHLPDDVDESLALCDICVAKYGKITKDNLIKALETTGQTVKKISDAALSIEKLKKKAFNEWCLNEHNLSDDDVYQASSINTAGKTEYLEKSLQAFALLEDWKEFYDIIAEPVHKSNNMKAMRFLADMQDASGSIMEYLSSEKAYNELVQLKETFAAEVYPKLQFEAEKASA